MRKQYKCDTCRDIGMVKEGKTIVTIIAYPGGDQVCRFVEPNNWDYKECAACNGKSWMPNI